MAHDQPTAPDKPTDPQPTGKSKDGRSLTSNVTPFLSKGKPYLWLATNQRLATIQPIPNTGVKVNEAKEQVQFLKGNHTYDSQPTCGSRQTNMPIPYLGVKVKMDGA